MTAAISNEELLAQKRARLAELEVRERKLIADEEKYKGKLRLYEENNKIIYFGQSGKGYLGKYGKWGPNPLQEKAFRAIEAGKKRIVLLSGANQIGKTLTETCIAMGMLRGYWPWEDPKEVGTHLWDVRGWSPPISIRWIGQAWEGHIQKVLIEKGLEELWPKSWPVHTKKQNLGVIHLWKDLSTGNEIQIMSTNQHVKEFEGWTGHCIESRQQVLMFDGTWKCIADIEVGDIVWSINDNNYLRSDRKVTHKKYMGDREVYDVELAGGTKVCCTADHKIWTRTGWVEAKDLTNEDIVYTPLVESRYSGDWDGGYFCLGAYIGDGWTSPDNGNNGINIANANKEFLELFEDYLPDDCRLKHRKKYDYAILPSNNSFYKAVKTLGLKGKKSHEKFIPQLLFLENDENKIKFLQGLYATDGWVTGKTIGYGSTSERLVRDLHKLMFSLGIYGTINKKKSQKEGIWRDQWFYMINKNSNIITFCELIGIPSKQDKVDKALLLARDSKKTRINAFGNYAEINSNKSKNERRRGQNQWFRFKKRTAVGVRPVYDITVSGYRDRQNRNRPNGTSDDYYHNFICEGIKVSNCVLYDEPATREIWIANQRGLIANKGLAMMGATLLNEGWISSDIINKVNDKGGLDTGVAHIHGKIYENEGFGIDKEGIDYFAAQLTPEERLARIEGQSVFMSSLVLNIDRDKNVIPRQEIPSSWLVDIGIDIGIKKPNDILYKAVAPNNMHYLIFEDEIVGSGEKIGDAIIRKINKYNLRVNRIICDPLAKGSQENENSNWDKIDAVLNRHGYILEAGCKDKEDGVTEINSHLMTINKLPALFIFNDLHKAVNQLVNWVREPDQYGALTKISKKNDDQCENLYRLMLLGTEWEEKVSEDREEEGEFSRSDADPRTGY